MRDKEIQFRWRATSYQNDAKTWISKWSMNLVVDTTIANPAITGINYRRHRIKPYLRINENGFWKEYPTGIFLLNTPTRKYDGTVNVREVEAYDQTVVLRDSKTMYPLTLAPDPVYGWTKIVNNILTYTGIDEKYYMGFKFNPAYVNIPLSSGGGRARKRTYDMGTSWLEIVNDLLNSASYESLWFDSNGVLISRPYSVASSVPGKFSWSADSTSIIMVDIEETIDTFDVANVFVVANTADEWGDQLVGRYINDNLGSPSSVSELGRYIVDYRTVEHIDNRTEMDNYVYRVAFNASQVYSQIRIDSALEPSHEHNDIIVLNYPDANLVGGFTETAWTMHLDDNPYMEHRLRRNVSI